MHAEDFTANYPAPVFGRNKKHLSKGWASVQDYLTKWRLKLSPGKTVRSAFYVRNHCVRNQQKLVENNQEKSI